MTDTLVLYTNPMSRGRIARWMLEEAGAPYRAEILEYGTTMKSPEYWARVSDRDAFRRANELDDKAMQ